MSIRQETVQDCTNEGLACYHDLEQTQIAILKACRKSYATGDYYAAIKEVEAVALRPLPTVNKLLFNEAYYKRFGRANVRRRIKRYGPADHAPPAELTPAERYDKLEDITLSSKTTEAQKAEAHAEMSRMEHEGLV